MRCSARNPAAAISGKNTRHRRERRCATTIITATPRRGNTRGLGPPRSCIKSRSNFITFTPRSAATSRDSGMKLILHIWRQRSSNDPGRMVRYEAKNVNPDMSFLEMLDVLNQDLLARDEDPIAFDHDCREGICGMCGFMIKGVAHGAQRGTTVCKLHIRTF